MPRASSAAVLAIASCVFFLSGCTEREAERAHHPEPGKRLVIATQQEPRSLNPILLSGLAAYAVSELSYSYLTNYDSHGAIVPDVASVVPSTGNGGISAAGRIVTYHLRRDVRWQDGQSLTAKDVVFTYRAIMNPDNPVQSRFAYDRIEGISAPDNFTVVVRLREPFSPLVANFFGGDSNYAILPSHLLSRYANLTRVPYDRAPIGSGPYRVSEWTPGESLTYVGNRRYYGGNPAIERLDLHFMHDSSTIVNELATGEADATFYADVTRIAALRALPDRRVVVTPVPGFDALIFNLQSALAGDSAVRHAFAMAIDRRQIVGKITHGLYDADTGARGLFTWAWDPNAAQVPYDPAGAAALLDRDGWVRAADGTRMKDGHRLEMQFGFYGGNDIESEFVPLIVEQERAAGITVTAKRYTREMFTALDGPLRRGRFDVALYSYQASYDPDVSWLLSCAQRAPAGFNEARYCNAAVDAALARGETSFDRTTRKRAYADVQRRIAADLPYDFLCQISEIDVIPSWLQGYEPPLLSPYVSVARWH